MLDDKHAVLEQTTAAAVIVIKMKQAVYTAIMNQTYNKT
jgi:hypothetical protein